MIKIVFCADTHLGFDMPIFPRTSHRRRGNDFFNNFAKVLQFARSQKADFLVHGGDLFHRSKVPALVVNKTYKMLFATAENGIKIILVPGNHERSILPDSIFTKHPNIYIFDEPKTYGFIENDIYVQFVGFPNERANIRDNFLHIIEQASEGINDCDHRFLCCHQTLQGANIKNFTFRYGRDVLPLEYIPEHIDSVLSGHIHRAQVLQHKNLTAIYPGSTEKTSIVEKDEQKGFVYLELDQDGLKYNFEKLPTRPMYNLEVDFYSEDEQRVVNWLQAHIQEFPQEAVVRLKCDIPQTRKLLKAELLQNIFPNTMSYRLAPISRKSYGN
ncbi:MAG: repair protein SbcD/Mre11 [Candidatus Cloacimonadota bacterium]|jgi:DNA repair exonuclease SbcCD nuclease subunit|nr:repair protein SbcD/Mre11 [Candidatus Cloacimonadota bacterium]